MATMTLADKLKALADIYRTGGTTQENPMGGQWYEGGTTPYAGVPLEVLLQDPAFLSSVLGGNAAGTGVKTDTVAGLQAQGITDPANQLNAQVQGPMETSGLGADLWEAFGPLVQIGGFAVGANSLANLAGFGGGAAGTAGAGSDLVNIDPNSLGLSNVDDFGGLTQLASDTSGLEARAAGADFGMGEFAGYPSGWESGAANAAPGVASTGVDAFGGLPWGNAAAGNPGAAGTGLWDTVSGFMKNNPWVAPVAGQVLGSGIGYLGATKAAGAQEKAAGDAQGLAKYMYDQNRADLAPWRQAGEGALSNLVNLTTPGKQLDTAMLDPGYAFRQAEGEKGINRAAAARGLWDSGATYKALDRFNQDYATGEFGNVYNRNANLAGLGQVGTNMGVQAGQNYANNAGNLMTQGGNARASGYVGGANALSGGLSSLINNYNQQTSLDKVLKAYGLG